MEFEELFEEPKPARSCDHEIPLVPHSKIVNIGPYRYSHDQKKHHREDGG